MFGVQLQAAEQVTNEVILNAVLGFICSLMLAGFFNLGQGLVRNFCSSKRRSDNLPKIRARFAFWYVGSRWAVAQEMIAVVMSLASCTIFIVLTVQVQNVEKKASDIGSTVEWDSSEYEAIFKARWLIWTEFVISLYFALQYFLEFFMAPRKFSYMFSIYALIDQLTIVPAINAVIVGSYFYGFQFLRFVRILKSLMYLRDVGWTVLSGVVAQAAILVVVIFSIFFASAGFIFVAENNVANYDGLVTNFLDAIYFIIVSFTTVGYGDISPKSQFGKVVVMAMIIVGIAVIPNQLDRLLTLSRRSRDRGHRSFKETGHVVVYSHVSHVMEFFREFYHKDHGRTNLQSVLLLPNSDRLPREVENALAEPSYHYRVVQLIGSAMNAMDLKRANLGRARHVFMLANRYAANPDEEDARLIVEALALRKFHPYIDMSIQILDEKHRSMLQDANIQHLLCVNELRMGMLAQAVLCPGFSTFVANLLRSVSKSDLQHSKELAKHRSKCCVKNGLGLPQSYFDGLGRELYVIHNMAPYAGLTFCEMALIMYNKFKVMLLALVPRPKKCSVDQDERSGVEMLTASLVSTIAGGNAVDIDTEEMVVNPGHGYSMPDGGSSNIFGIIIGNDESDVALVEAFKQDLLKDDDHAALRCMLKRFKKNRGTGGQIQKRHDSLLEKASPFRANVCRSNEELCENPLQSTVFSRGTPVSTRALFGKPNVACDDNANMATNGVGSRCVVGPNGMVEAWTGGKHILVIGDSASDIVAFVHKIRSFDVKHQKPIVVVTPTGVRGMESAQLMRQSCTFQMLGRPTDMGDLIRAGLQTADNVVILGSSSNEDASLDAQSIAAYRLAKQGTAFPIVDLVFAQNSASLGSLATENIDYLGNPYYAAGQMFASSCLDTLLCQTYYEQYQLQTVRCLLSGRAFCICIEVHLSECIDQPVSVLFDVLLRSDLLTLGLYRRHRDTPLCYVISVPDPDLLVERDDVVYVLNSSALAARWT